MSHPFIQRKPPKQPAAQISASKNLLDAPTSNGFGCYYCYKHFSNRSPYKKLKYPSIYSLFRVVHTKDTYLYALLLKIEQLIL